LFGLFAFSVFVFSILFSYLVYVYYYTVRNEIVNNFLQILFSYFS
jgi:hypothetical protein